jgi:hypothetical protein
MPTVTEQQERMLEDQQELRIRTRFSMKKKTWIPSQREKVTFQASRGLFLLLLRPAAPLVTKGY